MTKSSFVPDKTTAKVITNDKSFVENDLFLLGHHIVNNTKVCEFYHSITFVETLRKSNKLVKFLLLSCTKTKYLMYKNKE